jgi:para-aminobenzoate synthetase/4-amino-4-deoxychorismate lyase
MHAALLYDHVARGWLAFPEPLATLEARALPDVLPLLAQVDAAVNQRGLWAAGFLAYESAPAFDPALVTHPPLPGLPLARFTLHQSPISNYQLPSPPPLFPSSPFLPNIPQPAYHAALASIKNHIAAGDTYQVNYTLRLRAAYNGDPIRLFHTLLAAQPGGYPAYIHTGRHAILSASPELFFTLDGETLTSRPMKGTAPRGRTTAEDAALAQALHASEKNRAENVMIVDMIRNDLGRIARIGSVHAPRLFDVERHPTLHQMTSTVTARTAAPLPEILRALFPCASITGAPKVRTMQIIRALEPDPRGIYTGAIGWLAPGRRARFSVAIRTLILDTHTGQAEYGTGSGITWDSDPAAEYAETLLKARILTSRRPDFAVLESLRWTPAEGYWLLERHLARMKDSAAYFNYPFDEELIRARLGDATALLERAPHKIRIELGSQGDVTLASQPLPESRPLSAALAACPVSPDDVFLFHKTTRRSVYDLARLPGFDETLLYNERGEITEFLTANVVVQIGGRKYTPPAACGLLAGTFRAELLAQGAIAERVVTLAELPACEAVWAINSVRGWREAALMPTSSSGLQNTDNQPPPASPFPHTPPTAGCCS